VPFKSSNASVKYDFDEKNYADAYDKLIDADPMYLMSRRYNRSKRDEITGSVSENFVEYFKQSIESEDSSDLCVSSKNAINDDPGNMFYDVNKLAGETDLIDNISDAIKDAIDLVELNTATCKQKKHSTKCGFQKINSSVIGDDLSDFTFELRSQINERDDACDGLYFHVEPITTRIRGLDGVIKSALSTLYQENYAYANYEWNETTQSYDLTDLPPTNMTWLSTKQDGVDGGQLQIDVDFKVEMRAYILNEDIDSLKVKGSFSVGGDGDIPAPYEKLTASVVSQMNYGVEEQGMRSMDNYQVLITDMEPGIEAIWDIYWDNMFQELSDEYEHLINKVDQKWDDYNPFNYLDKAVKDILAEGDDYIQSLVSHFATEQLNSDGIKPVLDDAFEAMYTVAAMDPHNAFPYNGWESIQKCPFDTTHASPLTNNNHWHDCDKTLA